MKPVIMHKISLSALGLGLTLAATASASSVGITGTVAKLVIQDTTVGGNYFTLNATTGIASCAKDGAGHTMAIIPDSDRGKAMISVVEAAYLAGKTISVQVNDRTGAYCVVDYVQFQ